MARQGLMITGFVVIMMLVVEYLNVLSRGKWDGYISRWGLGQSVFAAFLGAIPGCLGAYVVGSLYMHRVVSAGALLACMVATCGDEAFVMLALFPGRALALFAALFAAGVGLGIATDVVTGARRTRATAHLDDYRAHHAAEPACIPFSVRGLVAQWRHCTPHRGWLTLLLLIFVIGVASGIIGHDHSAAASPATTPAAGCTLQHAEDAAAHSHNPADVLALHAGLEESWVRFTLLGLAVAALLIVATVPDHFLDQHLWEHLIRVHAWRILLWSLGAMVVAGLLTARVDLVAVLAAHRLPVILIACLAGLLPVSGPHLVFTFLYADGTLPLSVLAANSLVQDGHGLLPTLAHSRRAFGAVKLVKLVLGLAVGMAGHLLHW